MLDTNNIKAKSNEYPAYSKLCIVKTPEVVKVNKLMQVNIGQGEGDTRWKGCPWKALLLRFDIFYCTKSFLINTYSVKHLRDVYWHPIVYGIT